MAPVVENLIDPGACLDIHRHQAIVAVRANEVVLRLQGPSMFFKLLALSSLPKAE